MYIVKIFWSDGDPLGEVSFEDIDDALECVKGHITTNNVYCTVGDEENII
jgi:hypothetical protein